MPERPTQLHRKSLHRRPRGDRPQRDGARGPGKARFFAPGRRGTHWRRALAAALLLAAFLYAAVNLVQYSIRAVSTRRTNAALQAMYGDAPETPRPEAQAEPTSTPVRELLRAYQYIGDAILPEAAELHAENPDMVAWLRIPGVVSLPVVYRDNRYYLDHDFNGKKSASGTLFLDEAHPLAEDTQYLVVHGHNMHDGSMFGLLSRYRRRGYLQAHPTVYLNTLYRREVYEAVGVLVLPDSAGSDGYVPYTGTRRFQSVDQFDRFAESIRERALYWRDGAELYPGDALLALSTCYGEGTRIVVMCRRTGP